MGAPRKEINKQQFESLCAIQCTVEEMCAVLDCKYDALSSWCKRTYHKTISEVVKEKKSLGLMSLRRYQFKQAERNAAMAIWLGKQYLGQTDKVQASFESGDALGVKIEVIHDVPSEGDGSQCPPTA